MLIRSQDKKTLVNLDNTNAICIYECDTGFTVDAWGVSIDHEIGEYSTEEKAIKVLDMICDSCRNTAFIDEQAVVFQMPQDEDVEV